MRSVDEVQHHRVKRKVFGIGFHKTGTTSLRVALERLGYRVTGPDWVLEPDVEKVIQAKAVQYARNFDGFQDNPWPLLYRKMDVAYPGSRFILTSRRMENWINSCVQHFGRNTTPMREWIYGFGSPVGNEAVYIERHRRHLAEVRAYFHGRSDQFLELDFSENVSWFTRGSFLGHSVPDEPFPHANSASDRTGATSK